MTIDAGGEAATTAAPEQQERDFEAEAADSGWRPKEEWTGKPEHWKDAQTWVENGDTKTRIAKVEREAEERFNRLEKATSRATAALIVSYEKQITDLKAEKKAAIKEGDADRVDAIEAKIDDLKDKVADPKPGKPVEEADDDFQPVEDSPEHNALRTGFMTANPWMIEEPDMADYAVRVSQLNAAANPKIGFKANMKAVLEKVRKKYPAYFADEKDEKPAANGHAAVDAGGSFSGSTRTKKTFSDLPKEAQTTYERFDPKIKAVLSKEKYTREYYDA